MVVSVIGFWLLFGSLRYTITEFAAFAFCFTAGLQRAFSSKTLPANLLAPTPKATPIYKD
jgi:hypothetical protein